MIPVRVSSRLPSLLDMRLQGWYFRRGYLAYSASAMKPKTRGDDDDDEDDEDAKPARKARKPASRSKAAGGRCD